MCYLSLHGHIREMKHQKVDDDNMPQDWSTVLMTKLRRHPLVNGELGRR